MTSGFQRAVSSFPVLGLQMCSTTPAFFKIYFWGISYEHCLHHFLPPSSSSNSTHVRPTPQSHDLFFHCIGLLYTQAHTVYKCLLSPFNIVICVQSQPLRLATLSGSLSLKKPALPSPRDHQPPVALSRGEACENSPIPLACQQGGAVLGVSFRQRC